MSAELLAVLLDDVAEAMLWLDAAGRLRWFNRAALALFDCELGEPAARVLAPLGAPAAGAAARQLAAATGEPLASCVDGAGRALRLTVRRVGGGCLLRAVVHADPVDARGAPAQARRAPDDLDRWLELAGSGMLVFDDGGRVVRSNPTVESLIGQVPARLGDASPELQALLGWQAGAPLAALQPGAKPVETEALVLLGPGRRRRLGARLSAALTDEGRRRFMAVVLDRSAEDERDLARLEMGMLMDTASVGVATYDPSRGWLMPSAGASGGATAGPAGTPARRGGGLQGIGRELVEPESVAEYERLQRALRMGERAEVRYAVRHPELGRRWLLTRVEPGALSGGRPMTSVVTLDVTEQEQAQRRNEQLLRELTTILDGSTAGIAYLRDMRLVRVNHRFERLLGLAPGSAAGATLDSALGGGPANQRLVTDAAAALRAGAPFEAEVAAVGEGGATKWHSLSLRRADPALDHLDAVAVLTDVTRLKAQQAELERLLRDRELMFSLSDVGIVYLRGARIERANQAMAQLTGYAATELPTLDPAELYESARACVDFEALLAQGLRQQGRFSGERRLRRRDGSLPWVQVVVRPVDAADPDAGVICSFVDVDERYRARDSLAEQAARTRAILDSVLVGIVTVSDRGIEWMNRSARRMFGGELADFVGEPISIVAGPEPDHPLRRADYVERLDEGQAETFECRLEARDGREFWVVGNAVVTGRDAGSPQLTFALLDIERRRQAEVSIAQAQASLQRVIETAPLAIALFDARTQRVLQLNQMASAFFGGAVEDVRGRTPAECLAPPRAALLAAWLREAGDRGEVLRHELTDDASAGAEAARCWDTRIVPLAAMGAEGAQLLLVASDVTEQRVAEAARLQDAIAQRELLVREVHHRIKNNLQGVAGLLQQNALRHPELTTLLDEAVGQVKAIAQVYGLQVGSGGPLRVAGVVGAIAQSVQRTFGRAIRFDAAAEVSHLLPEAESIPVALTVNELLTNAVKHGGEGTVRCAVTVEGEGVAIEILNPGRLPEGFDLARVRGGVSGLGLVRSLLPRRSASLQIDAADGVVSARIQLRPPGVRPGG